MRFIKKQNINKYFRYFVNKMDQGIWDIAIKINQQNIKEINHYFYVHINIMFL